MTPHYTDDAVTLFHGDCLDVMRQLPDNSVDSVVTDPPYGINFMGKAWDGAAIAAAAVSGKDHTKTTERSASMHAGRYDLSLSANAAFGVWCEGWTRECLRVLKPGGHLLAFGGTRTWHRLACAVEDVGFEVRDSLAWLYGSGFPKSLDVSKAIDKAAGAERQVIGRTLGTRKVDGVADSTPWSTGAKQEPVELDVTIPATDDARRWQGWCTALKPAFEPVVVARKPLAGTVAANVLAHGTGALNIDGCRVGTSGGGNACPGGDACACVTSGVSYSPTKHPTRREGEFGRWPANVLLDSSQADELDKQSGNRPGMRSDRLLVGSPGQDGSTTYGAGLGKQGPGEREGYNDDGGASRFFPTFRYEAKAPTVERPRDGEVTHPTVKPLDLMRWLVRLVTPPGGTVLEPFAGSGTTAEACVIEGLRCIAVEREASYLPLIVARLSKPIALDLFGGVA